MRIALGSDHAGFELKEKIKKYLNFLGDEFKDFGAFNRESCDYPDYAKKVARGVSSGKFDRGILFCGSGIGMSMAANKIRGIRASLCYNEETARLAREHNDANVLCIGARLTKEKLAKKIVKIWLETKFSRGRHRKRVKKIG